MTESFEFHSPSAGAFGGSVADGDAADGEILSSDGNQTRPSSGGGKITATLTQHRRYRGPIQRENGFAHLRALAERYLAGYELGDAPCSGVHAAEVSGTP